VYMGTYMAHGQPICKILWGKFPSIFQGADQTFPWLTQAEVIIPLHVTRMEMNSIVPLMIWSMYLGLMVRMLVLWSWMWCPVFILCFVQLTCLDIPPRHANGAPSTWCQLNGLSIQDWPNCIHSLHAWQVFLKGIYRQNSYSDWWIPWALNSPVKVALPNDKPNSVISLPYVRSVFNFRSFTSHC
jgi:hypothetical protein